MELSGEHLYNYFLLASSGAVIASKAEWSLISRYFSGVAEMIGADLKQAPSDDSDKAVLEKIIVKIERAAKDEAKREAVKRSIDRFYEFDSRLAVEHGKEVRAKVISIFDDDYPPALRHINSPPLVIFVAGANFNPRSDNFAVVGTRSPSAYSTAMCEIITPVIAAAGYNIVSGMALGIDTCAHLCALNNQRPTYAVTGTGFDEVYPGQNRNLHAEIIRRGAVISEYLPGEGPQKQNFVYRNRIITGLSCATLVCGAGYKSGAIISANYAFEQSREVFTITGDGYRADMKGCHELIKKNIAKLVLNGADILDDMRCGNSLKTGKNSDTARPERAFKKSGQRKDAAGTLDFDYGDKEPLSDEEKKVISLIEELSVKNDAPPSLELLGEHAAKTIKISRLLVIISALELKGAITTLSGKRYEING